MADEEYPPCSLLILGSCIFLNLWAATGNPMSSEWFLSMVLAGRTTSSWYLWGVDEATPPHHVLNVTCLGWWLGIKLDSSARRSSKKFDLPWYYIVLTIPRIRLKIPPHVI